MWRGKMWAMGCVRHEMRNGGLGETERYNESKKEKPSYVKKKGATVITVTRAEVVQTAF